MGSGWEGSELVGKSKLSARDGGSRWLGKSVKEAGWLGKWEKGKRKMRQLSHETILTIVLVVAYCCNNLG